MLRGEAALPFKDIIRNFDIFTQSVIASLVTFNRKFNPDEAMAGDYNVVARGATSLIAKEVRGIQIDTLVSTLTPMEADHVDERKLVEQRFAVRDMQDVLLPLDKVERQKQQRQQQAAEQQALQRDMVQAEVRKTLADAFKAITQGQKNAAAADAQSVNAALTVLEAGTEGDTGGNGQSGASGKSASAATGKARAA